MLLINGWPTDITVEHAGYRGWPTHKPPPGWREDQAREINDLMWYARCVQRKSGLRDWELYPAEVLY